MRFRMRHTNLNVLDLDKSLRFYQQALDMQEVRRHKADDGSFELAFMTDVDGVYQLELTCLHDRKEPYDLSDNEIHIAFSVDDYAAAHQRHQEMGCICFENPGMGVYFIEDPDGYWTEIVPEK